jgi:hypothetical protein
MAVRVSSTTALPLIFGVGEFTMLTATGLAALQTNFDPDLMQVCIFPLAISVCPCFKQAVPATLAEAGLAKEIDAVTIATTATKRLVIPHMVLG